MASIVRYEGTRLTHEVNMTMSSDMLVRGVVPYLGDGRVEAQPSIAILAAIVHTTVDQMNTKEPLSTKLNEECLFPVHFKDCRWTYTVSDNVGCRLVEGSASFRRELPRSARFVCSVVLRGEAARVF